MHYWPNLQPTRTESSCSGSLQQTDVRSVACVTTDGDGAYARLRSHLLTFEVEPMERLEV